MPRGVGSRPLPPLRSILTNCSEAKIHLTKEVFTPVLSLLVFAHGSDHQSIGGLSLKPSIEGSAVTTPIPSSCWVKPSIKHVVGGIACMAALMSSYQGRAGRARYPDDEASSEVLYDVLLRHATVVDLFGGHDLQAFLGPGGPEKGTLVGAVAHFPERVFQLDTAQAGLVQGLGGSSGGVGGGPVCGSFMARGNAQEIRQHCSFPLAGGVQRSQVSLLPRHRRAGCQRLFCASG